MDVVNLPSLISFVFFFLDVNKSIESCIVVMKDDDPPVDQCWALISFPFHSWISLSVPSRYPN